MPFLFGLFGARFSDYAGLLMGHVNSLVWFSILYPVLLSLLVFRFFGPSFFFLYLSTRRCLGEAIGFSLPSARRARRTRRAAPARPATIAWLALPSLMAVFLLYHAIIDGKSRMELFDAATDGRHGAALRAIDSGLTVNATDRHGWTPLMVAAARGDAELLRDLLSRHANLNARNSSGATALMLALWYGHPDEAEALIAAGADVRIADEDGRTALFAAAMRGDAPMCRLLLARGADRAHRDQSDKTAIEYAREEGHDDAVSALSK